MYLLLMPLPVILLIPLQQQPIPIPHPKLTTLPPTTLLHLHIRLTPLPLLQLTPLPLLQLPPLPPLLRLYRLTALLLPMVERVPVLPRRLTVLRVLLIDR